MNNQQFRKCGVCMAVKPISEFYKAGKTKNGQQRISFRCKSCHKKVELLRYIQKKQQFDEFKTPCEKCGEDRPYLIEFHHTDPTKKEITVGAWRKTSHEKTLAEIKKCRCLCKNCHAEYHHLNDVIGLSYDNYIQNNFTPP